MARHHEIWVITRANNQKSIEKALELKPVPNIHWVYFDLPQWARFWKKGERGLHLYYSLWQIAAYFVIRKLHRKVGFELAHHVTFVNYWIPSFLAFLPIPFIWGPVGGGESAPRSFWDSFSLRGKAYELLRDSIRSLAKLNPLVRLAARKAAVGLATTNQTEDRLRALGCRQTSVFSEAGIPRLDMERLAALPIRVGGPVRFLSLGRLLHWKGFELSIRAFARFARHCPTSEYWIAGDGPERARLEKLVQDLRLAGKVRFWGLIPRSEVLRQLEQCDVLVHPSLHDSGGWVCLEAMAAGRPVVCLDLAGPALQVTGDTGVKVQAISPEQVSNDLAKAFLQLASDPALRLRLGLSGKKRVEEYFNWDKKGDFMANLYESLLIVEESSTVEKGPPAENASQIVSDWTGR